MSIGGQLGAAAGFKSEAKVHQANARVARAQGRAAKGQAYGQAARMEAENEVAGQQAVMNMERLREAETQARGSVQAARGGSGFSSEGSGSKAEVSVLQAFEQQAQDMAYSRALQDTSARFGAEMARKSGDLSEMSANVEADYTAAQAEISKIKKRGAYTAAAVEAAGMAIGGYLGATKLADKFDGSKLKGAFAGALIGSGVSGMLTQSYAGAVENPLTSIGQAAAGKYVGQKLDEWMKPDKK